MRATDVRIIWLNVHGGVFHKLLRLHGELVAAGLSCELIFSAGPPRGLKTGVDVPEALLPELAARNIHFLPRTKALQRAAATAARLLITDAHHDPDLPGLIAGAKSQGMATAQMSTLLGDCTCHGADHLLLQHPLTLFFELEYHHTPEAQGFFRARGLHFTGNIFFEPTVNDLHGGFASREAFFAKYGLDPARPLCLWLPNAADVRHQDYGEVVRAVEEAGLNLLVKLHPWEYVFKKHGVDTWGLGVTSDAKWNVRAVDEQDSSWAYRFCDLAVMRASATCLEMPFWRKPSVLLPSTAYPGLVRAQAGLVSGCSVHLEGIASLPGLLAGPLPRFTPEEYAAACASVRLDTSRDAYAQSVAAILDILEAPPRSGPQYAPAELKRLYDPFISQEMSRSLRFTRRLRFEAGRLLRRLTA
ncbi:MAG: hypothetical protein AB7E46_10830 [Desulfovibrio sp.]|jgi:hypothetical protein